MLTIELKIVPKKTAVGGMALTRYKQALQMSLGVTVVRFCFCNLVYCSVCHRNSPKAPRERFSWLPIASVHGKAGSVTFERQTASLAGGWPPYGSLFLWLAADCSWLDDEESKLSLQEPFSQPPD